MKQHRSMFISVVLVAAMLILNIMPARAQGEVPVNGPIQITDLETIRNTFSAELETAPVSGRIEYLQQRGYPNAANMTREERIHALQGIELAIRSQAAATLAASQVSNVEVEPQVADEVETDLNHFGWMPLVGAQAVEAQPTGTATATATATPTPVWTQPALPYTTQEIEDAEADAISVVDSFTPPHGQVVGEIGICASEGPGAPVWLINNTANKIIVMGHNDGTNDFGVISDVSITNDAEFMTITYEDERGWRLVVDISRFYRDNKTRYEITAVEYTGTDSVSLRFGQFRVLDELKNATLPHTGFTEFAEGTTIAQARYPARHSCTFSALRQAQRGQVLDAHNAGQIMLTLGFNEPVDAYGPAFGFNPRDDLDLFTRKLIRDCEFPLDGTNTPASVWGITLSGFMVVIYESKVCLLPDAYLLAFQEDPLGLSAYGVQLLSAYAQPRLQKPWPGNDPRNPSTGSSIDFFEHVQANFLVVSPDEQQSCVHKLTGPDDVCSNIRTAYHALHATLLCMDYQYDPACNELPRLLRAIMNARVGVGRSRDCEFQTEEYGTLCRYNMLNASFLAYKFVNTVNAAGEEQVRIYLPPKSTIEEILDRFGMGKEDEAFPVTNAETEGIVAQFFRVLLHRMDPANVPNTRWLPPKPTIPINGGLDWIGIDSYSTDTLGILQVATGAGIVCAVFRDLKPCNTDQPNYGLSPNMGIEIRTALRDFAWTGRRAADDTRTTCAVGEDSDPLCHFFALMFGLTALRASDIKALGEAAGCENVTVGRINNEDGGNIEVYPDPNDPSFNFFIEQGRAYQIGSTNHDCTIVLNDNQ